MNCGNCGAPMNVVDGERHYYCDYCDSQAIVSEVDGSIDGIVPSNQFANLGCPSCPAGDELMEGLLDEQKVDYCPSCLGVWMETEAFSRVARDRRLAYDGPDDCPAPVNTDALDRRRECPGCHATMEVHPYYGPGNVVLDSCGGCRRIWLDHGELTTIVRAAGRRRDHKKVQLKRLKSDVLKTDFSDEYAAAQYGETGFGRPGFGQVGRSDGAALFDLIFDFG